MTPLALALSRALIHFVWQGSIVGLSLWVILFGLRKKSAGARYLVSCAALGLLFLTPFVTTWVLYTGYFGSASAFNPVAVASQPPAAHAGHDSGTQSRWMARMQSWALPLWSTGVLLFSLRLALGYKHAFQLRRRAKPAGEAAVAIVLRLKKAMGVERRIRVLISAMSDSPSVVGWLRPAILLPAATLMGLTPLQLEAILAHEIGHIKRYDYLVNLLQMLVETLLFYHPAVWWTSKRIRLERELCCDDLAVRFSGNALRYARALTTLEKLRLRTPAVAMASTGGPLLYRIQRLAGVTTKDYGPSRLPIVLAMAAGVLCFALNVTWVRGQDAPGVRVDLGSSSVIHRTPVRYPEAALKQKITGTVQLEVKLDSSGNVADARVLSGPDELRKAALESVLNWHFTSDAARGSRLISISFSEQGTQVKVQEAHIFRATSPDGPVETVVFLKNELTKLEEAKQEIEAASRQAKEQTATLVQRQKLEREIALVRRKFEEAAGASPEEREILKVKLNTLRAEFEATRPDAGRAASFVTRVLSGISTPGMTDSVRNDILSRLPIREGDTLTPQLLEQTAMALRGYDEHLRLQFLTTGDGQTELRIAAPGAR
jgi:TonB family protein